MNMPKGLLALFIITGVTGCIDHIHFYGDGDLADFYKISTFLGEVTKIENCSIRDIETAEGNDIEGYEGREFYGCSEVMTFDEYRMMLREIRELLQAARGLRSELPEGSRLEDPPDDED